MTSQRKAMSVFAVALLATAFTPISSDVTLTLLYEHSSDINTISMQFNETMFNQFYTCLCAQERRECNIRYEQHNTPFPALEIQPKNLTSSQQLYSNYYQCKNNAAWLEVQCLRWKKEVTTCEQTNYSTIIPRASNISCDLTCIGLVWFNPGRESLVHNSMSQNKTKCPNCVQPPSAKTISTTVAPLRPITPPSTRSTISREAVDENKNDIGNDDNNSIPVIMGVVIGILSVILLAIAIIFVARRRKKRNLRKSRQNSTTRTVVSGGRNASGVDDYDTLGIEPTTSNTVSISDNTRTIPDFDLTTVLPSDDTNNREVVSTYVNHPHNGDIKHIEILDNFGYSTIDIGEEVSAGAEKADPSYENFPEMKADQCSEGVTSATGNDFPEHTFVKGHQHQQYYNFLTKQDGKDDIPLASFSPDSDLPESTTVNVTDKSSTVYVNSLTKAD